MSDIKISRTQKALRLIQDEGVTAKEAAERVGITGAAVSKGKHRPSKTQQKIRMFSEMQEEIESLRQQLAISEAEGLEQARLLGMSGEREAALLAEIERLKRDQNQLARNEAQKMLDNGTGGYYQSQITALRQQLAEKDAVISRLQFALADTEALELGTAERLAASQAREVQLREALGLNVVRNPKYPWKPASNWDHCPACFEMFDLDKCEHCGSGYNDEYIRVKESTDTTALSAMIAKAGEVMRESVIEQCIAMGAMSRDGAFVEEIRALPGVTLEDLK